MSQVPVNAMIDPGSSSCTMRASAAIKCQLVTKQTSDVLFGFGSTKCESARALGEAIVDIEIDSVMGYDVKVLVFADEVQPVDLLVGRRYTELPYIVYLRIEGIFKIGHGNESPFKDLEIPAMSEPRLRLRVEEKVQLEKNTMNLISVRSDGRENAVGVFDVSGRECIRSSRRSDNSSFDQ